MLEALFLICCICLAMGGVTVPNENKHMPDHLSQAEHFAGQEHNKQYDHDAFLGQDQAKSFDQLPPEESKRRLGVIVDRIDENKDGFITLVELKDWIRYTQMRYIDEDVNRHWEQHNTKNEETIPWETYRKNVYGFMDDITEEEVESIGKGDFSYKNLMRRDRRRWHHADEDKDDRLNKTEFSAFLHPEENSLMRDIVVLETLEDIDKDKDGKINLAEYIGDMYEVTDNEETEPDWVKHEREQFAQFRDTDGDGFMNAEEVRTWIAPADFDHAEAESRHLLYEADTNQDEKLTKEEIMDKYDLFVGSQATDFGHALIRHDEF